MVLVAFLFDISKLLRFSRMVFKPLRVCFFIKEIVIRKDVFGLQITEK